jgi:addiction module HigA family antidote
LAGHSGTPAALGVTRTTLSELVHGHRGISPEMAVRLSKVFGGSAQSWLTQQAQYDLAHVRADRIKLEAVRIGVNTRRGTHQHFMKPKMPMRRI